MVEIEEVLERSKQGRTRPFRCRGDDGRIYFVKGRGAGRRSQLREWIAGHIAQQLRLPIPPFEIVTVPSALLRLDLPHLELRDLGVGPAFGSLEMPNATDLLVGDLARVPPDLRRRVLLFDWWIRNDDRTLTELGGNPNLLWVAQRRELVVIDHNLAFCETFDPIAFMQLHVFAAERAAMWDDLAERAFWEQECAGALSEFDRACDNAPEEWWFADDERGVPADFDRAAARAILERYTQRDFWKIDP
ncbi:MAG: HipA family kinase [Aliidongia sp.]